MTAGTQWTKKTLTAWGNALVKTGKAKLNLSMLRQGREALANAAKMPAEPPDDAKTK